MSSIPSISAMPPMPPMPAMPSRHTPRHILFDIDDTLFPSTEFATLARKNALNAMISMGLAVSYEKLDRTLGKILKQKGSNYQNHFDLICRHFNVNNPARFVAAAVAAYHDTKTAIAPFPEIPLLLFRLRENGHMLYVATNGNAVKQWDKLIRLRIAHYFHDVFVSEEIGREKDVLFFRKVLKEIHAKPEDCIMIGDRETADIIPAKIVGLRTIRVMQGKYSIEYANIKTKTVANDTAKNIGALRKILLGA